MRPAIDEGAAFNTYLVFVIFGIISVGVQNISQKVINNNSSSSSSSNNNNNL